MFGKLFGKTTKKVEKAIDEAAEDVGDVITDAKQLLADSRGKINLMLTLAILGFALGITADVVSIAVGTRTMKLLKINERWKTRKTVLEMFESG